MDRGITSPLSFGLKSPFSPRVRQKTAKTPIIPSSLKKSSRFSASGKSVQAAQTVLKTPHHTVEKFGSTLPVIITEALTFAERNIVVSVRISDCGYAWLVCGRRLLVWQYRQIVSNVGGSGTPQRRAQSGQCFELTLPQSDLAHRAELVSVFTCPGSHTPSCVAVSPEGLIRYWPNVSHEGLSVEQTVDLQGQECDSLCSLGGRVSCCVLATTTCTVVLVQPRLTNGGRHSLHCRTLRTPSGWLGGIGKRMSSLIFGPMAAEHSGETRLVRVMSVKQSEDCWHVFVLAGHSLQKWLMSSFDSEQLVYAAELGRGIKDAYQCTAWESCGSDPADLDLWLLDVQIVNNNVMLLAAAVYLQVSAQVQYALIRLDADALQSAAQIEEFVLIKLFGLYQEDDTADFLSYRLLLCDNDVFVYRQRDITIVQPGNESDILDFCGIGDRILGGSVCNNTPIFFSRNNGLLAVYPADTTGQDLCRSMADMAADTSITLNDTLGMQTSNLSLYNLEPEDLISAHKDTVSQVKAAFVFHIKNQKDCCKGILTELFPEKGELKHEIDAVLDKIVVTISGELLDDVPVGDPRWVNEHAGLGSSTSMQIQHQLEDKQQAHNLYLQFLQENGLWQRLSAISIDNSIIATLYLLADHTEMLVAAIQLKSLTTTHNQLLQEAIDFAVNELYDELPVSLTKQDVFYRQVTRIHLGIWALVEKCAFATTTHIDPTQIVTVISETNNIILAVLSAVVHCRQLKAALFTPDASVTQLPVEYLPWTIRSGEQSLYDAIYKQQNLTLNYGARVVTDGATLASLYDQYVNLVDLLLDARKCHVESMKNTQSADKLLRQYQQERYNLIQPLVNDKQWERATLLAEKYLDFTTLIVICESTNNQQRLDEYLDKFKDVDFPQHMFNWYLREGKQGKLLARCKAASRPSVRSTSSASLTKFLGAHPQLKWLQAAFQGDYETAAQFLLLLASEEKELLTRKKSMLSFAKLSSFVANGIDTETKFVENINKELELIQYQEELPDEVLSAFGYDTVCQPVLDAATLAQLCISKENQDATEYDYKKALELADRVEDYNQRKELILKIWCSSILKDNIWKVFQDSVESPVECLQQTLFYKIADLAVTLGCTPGEILPPIDVLLNAAELGILKEDRNFQYLIKLGYDYFFRLQENDDTYRA